MVANGPRYKISTSGVFDPALSDLNLSTCLVDLLFGTCISTQGGSRLDGASSGFSRLSGSTLVTACAAITWGPGKDRKVFQVSRMVYVILTTICLCISRQVTFLSSILALLYTIVISFNTTVSSR